MALKVKRAKLIGHMLRHNNLLGRIIERSIPSGEEDHRSITWAK